MGRKQEHFYLLLFSLIIFGIFGYGIGKIYGMSIYPDEFGYWANAAQSLGYDWRETVSLGSYYSYGYSFLLFPILKFCKDGVTAYRMAIGMNALLQAGAVFPAWRIYRRLFSDIEKDGLAMMGNNSVMAAGMTVLYPVWTLYTQMTLTESLLCFLYLFGCYFLICYLKNGRTVSLIITSVLYVYLYMVHMRTIGTLLAYLITILSLTIAARREKKKSGGLYLALLLVIAGLVLTAVIKRNISDSVYALGDSDLLAATGYGGKLDLVMQVLTGKETVSFLLGCAGKLYYLLMASFGLLIPAVCFLIRQIRKMISCIHHKEKVAWQSLLALFVMLSFLGQFGVAALFMRSGGRLDAVFYGRYNEYLVPLLIGLGASELLRRGGFKRICLWGSIGSFLLFGLTFYALKICGADVIQGDFAAGINYITNDGNYIIEKDFVKSFLFGMALTALVIACLYLVRKKGRIGLAMAVVGALEICLAFLLSGKYTYRYNEVNYADIRLCDCLMEEENPAVFYLEEGDYQYIDLIQFTLKEDPVHVIRASDKPKGKDGIKINADDIREQVGAGGYLLVRLDSPVREGLEETFCKIEESGHFVLLRAETDKAD